MNKHEPFLQRLQDLIDDMNDCMGQEELNAKASYPDHDYLEDLFHLRSVIQTEITELITAWVRALGERAEEEPLNEEEQAFGEVIKTENKRIQMEDRDLAGLIHELFGV